MHNSESPLNPEKSESAFPHEDTFHQSCHTQEKFGHGGHHEKSEDGMYENENDCSSDDRCCKKSSKNMCAVAHHTECYVLSHPLKSVCFAFILGVVIGVLINHRH